MGQFEDENENEDDETYDVGFVKSPLPVSPLIGRLFPA
jgi:hypothetical protein